MTLQDSIKHTLGINKITLESEKPKRKRKVKDEDLSLTPLGQSLERSLRIWDFSK